MTVVGYNPRIDRLNLPSAIAGAQITAKFPREMNLEVLPHLLFGEKSNESGAENE